MKPLTTLLAAATLLAGLNTPVHALSGTEELSCTAILCLAGGETSGTCAPAIAKYYSYQYVRWDKTFDARLNFLNLCPMGASLLTEAFGAMTDMNELKRALVSGAGRCDAASLNQTLSVRLPGNVEEENYMIRDDKPDYCRLFESHEIIQAGSTIYVGNPFRGGQWVDVPASK